MSVVNVWSGGVSDTGAVVVGKVAGSSVRLAIADNAGMSGPTYLGPISPSAQGVVRFNPSGLTADTDYWYGLEVDGALDADMVGRFHTHGPVGSPFSFTFAHGTCAGGSIQSDPELYPSASALRPENVSNHPVFDDIRAVRPLFFAHGGDLHYYNISNPDYVPGTSPDSWRRAYDDVLATRQGTLYRNVPIQYMWDNHDFVQPGSDATSDGSAPGKDVAAQVYRERVPSYPLARNDEGIYHSFQVGRVLWIASDIRYYRDPYNAPAPRTMLGADQLAWMESVLSTSDAELLVWQQGQNWMNNDPGANWGSYTQARDELVQLFGDTGWLDKMFSVVGDSHAMAMDTGGGNAWGGFPVFMFSPLDSNRTIGPSYNLGLRGRTTGATRGQWGTVQITDTGPFIRVTAKGWYWTP